ncbi:MAG TPA: hypothetical protein DGT21_12175 [Armatimonadetes bacterium]|jgi:GT2 family glycosyltransferase|nr:hypothetical protein [Armatimonadota bacterium]
MTAEADPLSIGIVIPGHNFQRNFDWILEALAPQVLPGDRIVAVDDHSTKPIRVGAYGDGVDVDVAEVTGRGGPGNRSAARNVGWQRCDTALIMFLDGDMVPGPHSLSAIRALHARERSIVVKAERFALSSDDQSRGKRECLQMIADAWRWCEAVEGPDRTGGAAAANGPICKSDRWYYAASNAISVERRLVEATSGWDEGYTGWGEEDMDFAYRLHRAGAAFVFPPAEMLYAVHLDHPVRPDRLASLRANARRFVARFPEVYDVRLPAYEACGLHRADFDDLRGQRPPHAAIEDRCESLAARIGRALGRWVSALTRPRTGSNWSDSVYYR